MFKLLQCLAMLFAVTFFTNAFAVDQSYVSAQTQEFMQQLQAEINLSPEQKTEMEKILSNSINQREAVIAKYQGQKGMQVKKQIRNDLEPINDATRAEVQKVLDEQQYQAFLEVQEARQEKMRERINSEF